ncbi:MAG: 16S rRNA (guanine(527)-N(7))-methyltransferase RsmG [Candidatus Sulfotelmatobacter sp.]
MQPARIAELLQPYLLPIADPCHSEPAKAGEESAVLSATQLQCISTYIDILVHWNARINLTAIRTPEEIVTRHFGESLFAARHLFPRKQDRAGQDLSRADRWPVRGTGASAPKGLAEARSPKPEARLADLGSGAGFPGVPIKIWAPDISLTLIESSQKKATFLRELARTLTLTDIDIQNTRAETLPPSTFNVVTLRAVERLPKVLPVAAALLAPNGRLALLISSSQLESTCSTLPNLIWDHPIPIRNSQSRILMVGHAEPRI